MLNKYKFLIRKSSFLQTHRSSNHATHLRGIAALFVMAIHYNGIGLRDLFASGSYLNYLSNNFVNLGTRGPLVFYIASGYVLSTSMKHYKSFRLFIFIRYLRFMPLYFCISTFAYIINNPQNDGGVNLDVLIKKLLFLDIFFKDAYIFSPVSIAPFIVIEFWLSFLLLVTYIKNLNHIVLFVSSYFIYYIARHIPLMIGEGSFHYEILRSQFWFVLGIIACQLKNKVEIKFSYCYILLLLFISLALPSLSAYCVAVAAVLYILHENKKSREFYLLVFIGNICFSIYLLHLPLHQLVFKLNYFWTSGLVILVSMLTFYFIEQPFIKLGKKFR